ncbi:unnamed protein product [Ilex paraguariensis]|uniref:Uncharacterized protein n=1 Tax=Ilex paraguariensis TaxID=185542 RepID=A0ABC8UF42_9AQUA
MSRSTSDQVVLQMDQHIHKNQTLETQPQNSIVGDQEKQYSTNKPPTRAQQQTLRRLTFSKPKARFVEFNLPLHHKPFPESTELEPPFEPNGSYSSTDGDDKDDEEDEEEEEEVDDSDGGMGQEKYRKKKKKLQWRVLMEWVLFIIIVTCLICSLTVPSLKNQLKFGLEIWKWCLMVMVIFSGRLVSGWIIRLLVFLIERNFMLREKVLYFVYGLRKSIQNCVWLGLVLLGWTFMFSPEVHQKNKVVKKVFQALVAVLNGATIWLIKIVLVKVLASSFHVATYFDRMKESVFHHYILETLSGENLTWGSFLTCP